MSGDPVHVETLAPDLFRLRVPQAPWMPVPFDEPVSVYLLTGDDRPALVNAGPAEATGSLLASLSSLGVEAADVAQIAVTGCWPDLFGGAVAFPNAEVFALSDPGAATTMLRPGLTQLRRRLSEASFELSAGGDESAAVPSLVDLAGSDELARLLALLVLPSELSEATPVAPGAELVLCGRQLLVHAARGSVPGAMMLWDAADGWLFSSEVVSEGFEATWVHEPDALLDSVVAFFDEDVRRLFPNRGTVRLAPRAALKRTSLFVGNFVANARFALSGPTSAADMVHRDLGLEPGSVLHITQVLGYQAMLEQMVRNGLAEREGEGLQTRFTSGQGDDLFE